MKFLLIACLVSQKSSIVSRQPQPYIFKNKRDTRAQKRTFCTMTVSWFEKTCILFSVYLAADNSSIFREPREKIQQVLRKYHCYTLKFGVSSD